MALAIGTWVINIAFLILGMFFPFQLLQVVCDYANACFVIGPVRVSHGFMSIDYLWALLTFNLSLAALCMGIGPCPFPLWDCQSWRQQTYPHIHSDYRHHFTSHHARWLASSAPPWWWHFWSDSPSLETGLMILFSDLRYLAYE